MKNVNYIKMLKNKNLSQSSSYSSCLFACFSVFLRQMCPPSQSKHSYVHKFVHFQKFQFCRHSDKNLGCYDKRRWYHTKMEKQCTR